MKKRRKVKKKSADDDTAPDAAGGEATSSAVVNWLAGTLRVLLLRMSDAEAEIKKLRTSLEEHHDYVSTNRLEERLDEHSVCIAERSKEQMQLQLDLTLKKEIDNVLERKQLELIATTRSQIELLVDLAMGKEINKLFEAKESAYLNIFDKQATTLFQKLRNEAADDLDSMISKAESLLLERAADLNSILLQTVGEVEDIVALPQRMDKMEEVLEESRSALNSDLHRLEDRCYTYIEKCHDELKEKMMNPLKADLPPRTSHAPLTRLPPTSGALGGTEKDDPTVEQMAQQLIRQMEKMGPKQRLRRLQELRYNANHASDPAWRPKAMKIADRIGDWMKHHCDEIDPALNERWRLP